MGYTEACGTSSSNDSIVATGGINNKGIIGYYEGLFWAADDFEFASVAAMKDQANWDAGVAAGNLVYLGKGKFEDQSTEATFFEDAALDIREEQTPKIKSFLFTLAVCACTSAELEKMEGKQGRLFIQTSKGFVLGRLDAPAIKGLGVTSITVDDTIPTNDTPVRYTTLAITFSDAKGDRLNPAEVKTDFLFSEVDQVYTAEGVSANTSSNGSTLSTEISVTKGCSTEVLSGLVLSNFAAVDEDGNSLTIASVSETGSTGVYDVDITTALTKAYVSTDGIVQVSSVNYYMSNVSVSV